MEKRITFTPGPWRVTEDLYSFRDCQGIVDEHGQRIAVMSPSCPQSEPVKRANAELMAASPEMLEVLEWLLEEFDRRELGDEAVFYGSDMSQVRSVIRKARGEA